MLLLILEWGMIRCGNHSKKERELGFVVIKNGLKNRYTMKCF
jgi:hypothetical protein